MRLQSLGEENLDEPESSAQSGVEREAAGSVTPLSFLSFKPCKATIQPMIFFFNLKIFLNEGIKMNTPILSFNPCLHSSHPLRSLRKPGCF